MLETAEKKDYIFSLDIGTRSIIGMVGTVKDEKLCVMAIEKEEHSGRAMIDGQIEDIGQVAKAAGHVKKRLEEKTGIKLECVHVAAAGRALKTYRASFEMGLSEMRTITDDIIKELEAGAIEAAEQEFESSETENGDKQFYLIGYTVCQYYLDNYPISSLQDHKGKDLKADIIATFLPGEVVESLYAAMNKAGLEVASMTLEPIASMNASIPQKLRLLNLGLVDIGAGTSDIAVARNGSIAGYTMATIAGDEVTECLMREYIIDFDTAERLKMNMGSGEEQSFTDVLGFEHTVQAKDILEVAKTPIQSLCKKIAEKLVEVNGAAPSALFLAGGGSKLIGIREYMAEYLDMDISRIALGGNNFSVYAYSDEYDLKDPEYSTPLGIAVSAAHNLINDSFYIKLNGNRAKLFRSGRLTIRDVLMMNGFGFRDLMSHSGQNIIIFVNGERTVIHGEYATPAQLKLNGVLAAVSDVVKAGDEIQFDPAINGEDAKVKLSDLASLEEKGFVIWDGKEIPLGKSAMVNDRPGFPDMELKNGDKIETCLIETVEDFEAKYQLNQTILVNGEPALPERMLEDGDVITIPAVKAPMTIKIADKPKEEGKESEKNEESQKDNSSEKEEYKYIFTLNGKTLRFKEKPSQSPYYMMDMLIYTDLDLSNPEGDIQMKVNGEDSGFQRELKNGDNITISWSEKNSSYKNQ